MNQNYHKIDFDKPFRIADTPGVIKQLAKKRNIEIDNNGLNDNK